MNCKPSASFIEELDNEKKRLASVLIKSSTKQNVYEQAHKLAREYTSDLSEHWDGALVGSDINKYLMKVAHEYKHQ